MSDLDTAFKLLDIIAGHSGYTVQCTRCHQPLTDILGFSLPADPDIEIRMERGEIYHWTVWAPYGCPYVTD